MITKCLSNMTLKKDINEIDNEDIDTLASYLNALDKLFLLDNDEPFSTNILSSVRVKQSENLLLNQESNNLLLCDK